MLCQKEEKTLIFKGAVSELGKIFVLFHPFVFWQKSHSLELMFLFCTFWLQFLEKWILEEGRSLENVTIYPIYFRVLMRIFLQTQTLFAVAFLGGEEELKTQCDGGTDRKIACHASEKQTKGCLSINTRVFCIHSPCSSSSKTSRGPRCVAYFKNTKNISLASGLNYTSLLLEQILQFHSAE